jgi:hypothetical protein
MAYKKIGAIESIPDIPMNKNLIVNGHVNKDGWMWHMGGKFQQRDNEIIFKNEFGMVQKVIEHQIGLTVLEKV